MKRVLNFMRNPKLPHILVRLYGWDITRRGPLQCSGLVLILHSYPYIPLYRPFSPHSPGPSSTPSIPLSCPSQKARSFHVPPNHGRPGYFSSDSRKYEKLPREFARSRSNVNDFHIQFEECLRWYSQVTLVTYEYIYVRTITTVHLRGTGGMVITSVLAVASTRGGYPYHSGNVKICQFVHSIFRFFDDIYLASGLTIEAQNW